MDDDSTGPSAEVRHIQVSDGVIVFRPSTLEVARLKSPRWADAKLEELTPEMRSTLARADALVSQRAAVAGPNPTPAIAQLNVAPTNFCNMGCTYCYNELPIKDRKGSETEVGMSIETAHRMVDALVEQSGPNRELKLAFIGGEALIERRTVFATVAYAKSIERRSDKHFSFVVYTNGLLVDDAIIDWANENAVALTFSLDGPPLENDSFRILNSGRGTARKVLRQMRRFVDRYAYPVRTVTAVVNREGSITPTAQYLHDLGFNSLQIQAAYDESGYVADGGTADIEDLAGWYKQRLLGGDVFSIGVFTDVMVSLVARGGATKSWYPCNAGHRALGVGEDGRVYPCHHFFGEDDAVLGNIADGLPDLQARKALFHPVDRREPCASCWARHACGGECYHRAKTSGHGYAGVVRAACDARRHRIGLALDIFVEVMKVAPTVVERIMDGRLSVPSPCDEAYSVTSISEYRALRRARGE